MSDLRDDPALPLADLSAETLRLMVADYVAENERLRKAIGKAASALDSAERDPHMIVVAQMWLRTTYPADHPNYVTATTAELFEEGR